MDVRPTAYYDAALQLMQGGYHPLPVKAGTKAPNLPAWKEWQTRSVTVADIERWQQEGRWEGVCVICGRLQGYVVMDVDDPNKFFPFLQTTFHANYPDVETALLDLFDTPIVKTGGGGYHLYFRYPDDLTVGIRKFPEWGFELRGDGAIVVVPPTLHPETGLPYRWLKGYLETSLTELPQVFKDLITKGGIMMTTPARRDDAVTLLPADVEAIVAWLAPRWTEGVRHDLALGVSGVLAQLGVSVKSAQDIIEQVVNLTRDFEGQDRLRAVTDTYHKVRQGEPVAGWQILEQTLGLDDTEALMKLVNDAVAKVRPADTQRHGTTAKRRKSPLVWFFHNNETIVGLAQRLGVWETVTRNGNPAVAFPLWAPNGQVIGCLRYIMTGKGKWHCDAPDDGTFFAPPQVLDSALQKGLLVITESPADAVVLTAVGYPAIGVGSKENFVRGLDAWANVLARYPKVVLWIDPNRVGMAQDVANILERPIWVVTPPLQDALAGWDWNATQEMVTKLINGADIIQPNFIPTLDHILCAIENYVAKYVVLSDDARTVITLWAAHTWLLNHADATLYLHITSPEKGSGKTRLLEVLSLIVANPQWGVATSTAPLFRMLHEGVEGGEPITVLWDEVEHSVRGTDNEMGRALLAILNVAFRKGQTVARCVGENHQVVHFQVFGAFALCGLGKLTDTLADRCIPIVMQRRTAKEPIQVFYHKEAEKETEIIRQSLNCWRLKERNLKALQDTPAPPIAGISDRANEGLVLMLKLATLAGWKERFVAAVQCLFRDREDTQSPLTATLKILQEVFRNPPDDAVKEGDDVLLTTKQIFLAWGDYDEDCIVCQQYNDWKSAYDSGVRQRWAAREFGKWLAVKLRRLGIKSQHTRDGSIYRMSQFKDAWERYLNTPNSPDSPDSPEGGWDSDIDLLDLPSCNKGSAENSHNALPTVTPKGDCVTMRDNDCDNESLSSDNCDNGDNERGGERGNFSLSGAPNPFGKCKNDKHTPLSLSPLSPLSPLRLSLSQPLSHIVTHCHRGRSYRKTSCRISINALLPRTRGRGN